MKADSLRISKVFSDGGDIHYVLPHFQRQYSWEEDNWKTLLDDVFAIYDEYNPDDLPEHFLGSLVVINDGTRNGVITAFKLVDGQQRLTTISLLLCALRDIIKESHPGIARKIQKLLVNPDEENEVRFKVLPTTKYGDREAYIALVRGEASPATESSIPLAYAYLHKELSQKIDSNEIQPDQFFVVLSNCFQVVFIVLNYDESPYKIFESLNAKGKPLSQADLTRNYIAMKLPIGQQEKVFKDHWEKIEHLLQEKRTVGKSRIGELTAFLRHYLAMTSRVLCSEAHIYARFRDRCEREFLTMKEFINEMETLSRFAEYYDKFLRPEHEINQKIKNALTRLNTLELSTAYPFLLAVYDAYDSAQLSENELLDLFNVLENYMVRRYICGEPTNFLNKMFPTLWRDIRTEIENGLNFKDALRKVLATKNYPSDRSIQQAFRSAKLYDNRSQEKMCLVLESINRYLSEGKGGYTVLNDNPTIEHILPQKPNQDWRTDLGDSYEETYRDYLHTLGNLTLVTQEWNSSLSNSAFPTKKHKLAEHALLINSGYFSQEIPVWDETAILKRADFLGEKFLEIWSAFGEANPLAKQSYGVPKTVTICGETLIIPDKTWRQFMKLTVEWVLNNRPQHFDNARQILETYFCNSLDGKKNPRDWHQLSNGVWVFQSNSAKRQLGFCRRFLRAANVSESEWSLEASLATHSESLNDNYDL